MSQKPSLSADATMDAREEFSRWRCVWSPYDAVDRKKSKPFAQLTIVLDKAIGLSSPDFNGLADPYVTLCLNGDEENVVRSDVQKQTLAPAWNQTFVIDIFHPISILTVTVFDQEFGDSDFADFLHLDDILAGWVDLRIGAMPLNEWMCGWFDLGDPSCYKDTITGRLENPHPEGNSGCGRIHLKMRLGTTHPHDELFAMCLPLPDTGHSCHLDLADLVHDVVSLSKAMDKCKTDIKEDMEWLLHHSTPVFFLLMMVIWLPKTLFPCLAHLIPLALIYISSQFSAEGKKVPHGLGGGLRETGKADTQSLGATTGAAQQPPKKKAEKALTDKEKKELEGQQKADEMEKTLKMLVNIMPNHAAKELRKTAADMESLVQFVDGVETLAALRAGYGTKLLVVSSQTCALPLAYALLYFSSWQKLLVQIALTILVTVHLWQYSFPGRIATGFFYYFLAHWRLHARLKHDLDEDHESVEQKGELRPLARAHVKHMGLHAKGKLHDDHVDLHGHRFDLTTFKRNTWCDDCGTFLWGVSEQGFHCKACDHSVCPNCAHSDADGLECPGACKEHDYGRVTFHHTTWCHECDSFLWGVKEQGLRCKVCSHVVCHECGESPQNNNAAAKDLCSESKEDQRDVIPVTELACPNHKLPQFEKDGHRVMRPDFSISLCFFVLVLLCSLCVPIVYTWAGLPVLHFLSALAEYRFMNIGTVPFFLTHLA